MPSARGRALLVFAREPRPGQVKTRLIPGIGNLAATNVYKTMLRNTLKIASRACADSRALWVDDLQSGSWLSAQAAFFGLSVQAQRGRDLGVRMHTALAEALGAAGRAVLIGSDCPEMDAAYIETAFAALVECDVVLGPAADGGYVLIGLKRPAPALFEHIAWGTEAVLAATRTRLRTACLSWHELPTLHDLDDATDLRRFPTLAALAGTDAGTLARVDCTPTLYRRTPT